MDKKRLCPILYKFSIIFLSFLKVSTAFSIISKAVHAQLKTGETVHKKPSLPHSSVYAVPDNITASHISSNNNHRSCLRFIPIRTVPPAMRTAITAMAIQRPRLFSSPVFAASVSFTFPSFPVVFISSWSPVTPPL